MQYDIDAIKRFLTETEKRYSLFPGVLHQTAWNESRFKPDIISGQKRSEAGAIGLMQFMPATAEEYGIDPTDPFQAIDAAGRYWRKSLDRRNGDIGLAAADYNFGPGNVNKWLKGERSLPEETRKYMSTYEDPWAPNDGTVPPFQPGVDPETGRFATPDGLPPPQLRHGYDPNVQPPMAPPPPMPVQDPYRQTSLNPYMSPEQFQQLSQAVFQDYMNPPQEETLPPWVSAIGMIGQGLTAAVNPEMAQLQLLTQQAAIEAKRAERRDRRQAMIDVMQMAKTFGPQAIKDNRTADERNFALYQSLTPAGQQEYLRFRAAGKPATYSPFEGEMQKQDAQELSEISPTIGGVNADYQRALSVRDQLSSGKLKLPSKFATGTLISDVGFLKRAWISALPPEQQEAIGWLGPAAYNKAFQNARQNNPTGVLTDADFRSAMEAELIKILASPSDFINELIGNHRRKLERYNTLATKYQGQGPWQPIPLAPAQAQNQPPAQVWEDQPSATPATPPAQAAPIGRSTQERMDRVLREANETINVFDPAPIPEPTIGSDRRY